MKQLEATLSEVALAPCILLLPEFKMEKITQLVNTIYSDADLLQPIILLQFRAIFEKDSVTPVY